MKPEELIEHLTEEKNESNLCVVLRSGEEGLEALLVADEKGRWSIPGGHAKDGETNAEAAKREVKEETGLDVEPVPLLWAYHVARDKPTSLFFAITDQEDIRPGGGDVTKTMWTKLDDLGDLNGTDRLAIHVAANRTHNPQGIVDASVELAENQGFAVGAVAAPPVPEQGIYLRINGKAAESFVYRLSEWANSLKWPVTQVVTKPYESTTDALERASKRRKLTPMLEGILWVADALWRYESVIAPALAKGHVVIETGPEMGIKHLLERGLPQDLLKNLVSRVPAPSIMFMVGEDFDLDGFQALKDSIEQIKDPEDPKRYLDQLTPRQMQVPYKMEFVRENPDDPGNPVVRCPKCKSEGPLMDEFSYLCGGFNGIKVGDEDDLDAQECGRCAAKMEWAHIPGYEKIVKI